MTNQMANQAEALTDYFTVFSCFQDLLDAPGDYCPSLEVGNPQRKLLANLYDQAQAERGDPRRARRHIARAQALTGRACYAN